MGRVLWFGLFLTNLEMHARRGENKAPVAMEMARVWGHITLDRIGKVCVVGFKLTSCVSTRIRKLGAVTLDIGASEDIPVFHQIMPEDTMRTEGCV